MHIDNDTDNQKQDSINQFAKYLTDTLAGQPLGRTHQYATLQTRQRRRRQVLQQQCVRDHWTTRIGAEARRNSG